MYCTYIYIYYVYVYIYIYVYDSREGAEGRCPTRRIESICCVAASVYVSLKCECTCMHAPLSTGIPVYAHAAHMWCACVHRWMC